MVLVVVQGAEVLELAVEAAVLLRERLAAALERLAVHLRLLQLRPRPPVLEPHLLPPREIALQNRMVQDNLSLTHQQSETLTR